MSGIWNELQLKMNFTTPLCGGVPRSDEIVKRWCETRVATAAAHQHLIDRPIGPDGKHPQTAEAVVAERLATVDPLPDNADDVMSRVWVGFSRNSHGLFIRGANVRAHLKDCAETLGRMFRTAEGRDTLKETYGFNEIKQFAPKLKEAVYIAEDQVLVCNDEGQPYTEASGYRDATMSVMTAQGPRTCLKRIDYCMPAQLTCTIQLLAGSPIHRDHIAACLDYGQVHGFGQDRSLQFGQFKFTLGE